MNLVNIDRKLDFRSGSRIRLRIDTGCHVRAIGREVQEYFSTEKLVNFDLRIKHGTALRNNLRIIIQMLRTDTHDNGLADIAAIDNSLRLVSRQMDLASADVNDDGELNIKDVTLLKQHLAKWNVTINAKNADVDGDSQITIKDLTLIKQALAKWKVELK